MSECGKIMEVRSHTEKCGAAVGTGVKVPSAAATAASATPPPLPPSSEKSQMMSSVVNETNNNKSKEKGQYQSKTTVNVMNSSKMTKDESKFSLKKERSLCMFIFEREEKQTRAQINSIFFLHLI